MKTLAKLNGNTVVNIEAIDDWRCTNDEGQIDEAVAKNHLNKTGFNPNEYVLYISETHVNAPMIGGTYDSTNNKFISVKPFNSWTLNNTTYQWDPPVAYPTDSTFVGGENKYFWNETDQSWNPIIDGSTE
jgi:hypothetical protein